MTPEMLLSHADDATFWPCEKDHHRRHNVPSAYRDALAVRGLRVARGEQPVGLKVEFTNRTIWERYGVFAPIWGTVWNTTLTRCESEATLDLNGISQPRLEPEVAFCMSATPPAKASLEEPVQLHQVAGAKLRGGSIALSRLEVQRGRGRCRWRPACALAGWQTYACAAHRLLWR